jgi:3-dehydroquinate synthase
MVMAADLSSRLGLIDEGVVSRLRDAVAAAGLPVCGPAWPAEQYVSLMSVDKKASQGIPKFVLLEALGRAVVRSAPGDLVHQTLRACSAAQ